MEKVSVREVKTKKEQREFLNFPLDMYADNPCFVPPLYGDEKKIFSKNYIYYDTCEAVYFNAYRGDKPVGRISGILQKVSNEIRDEKRVRFTRFDTVDDIEVARALFEAVEKWAIEKGMDTVCGPLGFSDLEREGLLVEGFEYESTFEEQYNAPYYGKLIEQLGYVKEVDWTESRLRAPADYDGSLDAMTDFVMKRYKLHFGPAKNVNEFLKLYADKLFDVLDRSYSKLYGTVPLTEGMKKMLVDNFKLIVDLRFVAVILDENDNLVLLGICFPAIGEAVKKSRGHLTPAALLRILRTLKKPKVLDLALVGVDPAYLNRGVSTAVAAGLMRMLREEGIEYAETNLNLEDNFAIRNLWKRFDEQQHKRRRSYVKKLDVEEKL